jgi:hypothetical protein
MISTSTKHLTRLVLCVCLIFTIQSCVVVPVKTTSSGKVPPGQAKKATGSKSAKEIAPGQQKKKGKTK